MAKPLVSDALWERIEPLLPRPKRRRFRHPGRKPIDRRKVLSGIIFVLKTGIPWEELPQEMGCGCGMTCWNYLQAWQRAGVWQRLHEVLLAELQEAVRLYPDELLATLRQRLSLRGDIVSESGRQRTVELFGAALSPQQVVERICGDVRHDGLPAVLDYTARFDRLHAARVADLGVDPAAMRGIVE